MALSRSSASSRRRRRADPRRSRPRNASPVPRIAAPISRADVVSANSRTRRPSRMTPTRAASPATSGRRCETYRTPTPSPIIRRIVANRRSVSRSESAEVGSSRTRTRGSWDRARASTICWRSLEPSRSTTVPSGRSRPARSAISRARTWTSRPRYNGPRPLPRRARARFSATVCPGRIPASICWWTVTIPARSAASGLPSRSGTPATRTSPASGTTAPARIRMSVDLPAPLAPTSP